MSSSADTIAFGFLLEEGGAHVERALARHWGVFAKYEEQAGVVSEFTFPPEVDAEALPLLLAFTRQYDAVKVADINPPLTKKIVDLTLPPHNVPLWAVEWAFGLSLPQLFKMLRVAYSLQFRHMFLLCCAAAAQLFRTLP